jgi:mRNA interferase MazF
VKRGEIWLARLSPRKEGDTAKTYVCLVVSPPDIHDHLDVAIVAPMAVGSRLAAFRVEAVVEGRTGRFLLEQIRTLDKTQLVRCVGAVDKKTLSTALQALREMFAE